MVVFHCRSRRSFSCSAAVLTLLLFFLSSSSSSFHVVLVVAFQQQQPATPTTTRSSLTTTRITPTTLRIRNQEGRYYYHHHEPFRLLSSPRRRTNKNPISLAFPPSSCTSLSNNNNYWEGDDRRLWTRIRRRWFSSYNGSSTTSSKCRNILITINCAMFVYQILTSINYMRVRYPSYWPRQAVPIVTDVIWGSSIHGPIEKDFAFISNTRICKYQPHRYITSGFVHGGILHLLLNMDALRRLPNWLESGLGPSLYLTTYLFSIIAGNIGHSIGFNNNNANAMSLCLGSSGGICGLYGLMFISLARMRNDRAASRVMKGMIIMLLYGWFLIPNISNAAHIGGFVGGILIGLLCGPSYSKSYTLRRKWSNVYDNSPKDYRVAMGYDKKPSDAGIIPLPFFWFVTAVTLLSQPKFRSIPRVIVKGLLHPGSVL